MVSSEANWHPWHWTNYEQDCRNKGALVSCHLNKWTHTCIPKDYWLGRYKTFWHCTKSRNDYSESAFKESAVDFHTVLFSFISKIHSGLARTFTTACDNKSVISLYYPLLTGFANRKLSK